MVETRLTADEQKYYQKLFSEDDDFYTVVDTVKQLPMFSGKFHDERKALAFIEFLSNIFHICWQADVYRTNHLRLIDILFGMQYAIEFDNDREAQDDIQAIISKFEEIYQPASQRIPARVFAAGRELIDHYEDNIKQRHSLQKKLDKIIRLHPLYVILYAEQIETADDKSLPEWNLVDRKGVYLNPRTGEPAGMDSSKRVSALKEWLEQQ